MKAFFILFFGIFLSCNSPDSNIKNTTINTTSPPPDGKSIYAQRCVVCHGMDGKLGFGGAKNLTECSKNLDEIVFQVTNGKGAMAGFKNILSEEEILAVSQYAQTFNKKSK